MNIRIEDIAKIYNDLIGNHFNIEVNCNLDVNGTQTQGIMFATRRPFAVSGLKAEALDINLEFYVNVTSKMNKLELLTEISKLLGTKQGSYTSNGEEFTYSSFLEFGRPTSAPLVDMGNYKQVIFVNGSCFVSAKSGGVKMSNDIKTYLTFNGKRGRVYPKIININNVREVDAPTKANCNESGAQVKTQGVARSLSIYDLRDDICKELEKYIEITSEDTDPNATITIERQYPDFTVTKTCVITSGIITEIPGSFLVIELGLQKQIDNE